MQILAAVSLVLPLLAEPALAQSHIRGTLAGVKDDTITVQTLTKSDMKAVQPGKFVGITSVERGGKRVAVEVHVFAETLRGLGEGHYPWDLDSNPNMMTNANIAKLEDVGTDRVLKLSYAGGEQTISVPETATIVEFDKAGRDQLVPGRRVFVGMKKDAKEAAFVVIGAEGVRPPM
jgi:hypothetical protein